MNLILNRTSNCLAKKQTKHDVKYCYWLVSLSIHCVLLFALFTSTTLNKEPKIPLQVVGDTYLVLICLLYTSPSPRDRQKSRMPSSA